jgi:hypothetical protein
VELSERSWWGGMRCEMEGWRRREKWWERLVASLLRAEKAMAVTAPAGRTSRR